MLTFIVIGLLFILALAAGVLLMAFLPSKTAETVERSIVLSEEPRDKRGIKEKGE